MRQVKKFNVGVATDGVTFLQSFMERTSTHRTAWLPVSSLVSLRKGEKVKKWTELTYIVPRNIKRIALVLQIADNEQIQDFNRRKFVRLSGNTYWHCTRHTEPRTQTSVFTNSVYCVQSVTECTFEICSRLFQCAPRHLFTIAELQTLGHKATLEVAEQEKCINFVARKVRRAELQ
jgi:hypothetical protein